MDEYEVNRQEETAANKAAEDIAENTAGKDIDEMIESAALTLNSVEEKEKEPEKESSLLSPVFDIVSIVCTAAVIVAVAFIFFFRTVGVSGDSMFPTLHDGDRLILSAFVTQPKYGDIVVTCQPSAYSYVESTLVKRVIATEGQTVDIDFEKGIVYIDGKELDEPYLIEENRTHERESFSSPVTVPEGYIFVMGDNRNNSTDSRDFRVGLIREEYVMGKALFRIAPLGKFKLERY
ncbi:MAG: signal peptidase I [Clostridia bacterium]|nr:signal peptidase I [Clostridia bacterium]